MTSPPGPDDAAAAARRILVVEDEAMIRMLLADMLEELGFTIAGEAGRIEEALVAAKTLDFDLAILDVNLNGATIAPVAAVLAERLLPFVFATGYGLNDLPEGFRDRPALRKPFQMEELRATMENALTGKG
jgi:CheY-like chemotaxis protein